MKWQITVRVWPYSTKEGAAADKAAVGDEFQGMVVEADDIRDALGQAELFAQGIRANPRVWQANVILVALTRAAGDPGVAAAPEPR
jgi:hypothetical protein